ncbi:hypothetical protein Bca101_039710 [Brassica carinata]
MNFCLRYGNREAHYIEGAKHLFSLRDRTKGMRHLKISATKNYKRCKYLYAILKLLAGDHVEGMNLLDVHKWRSNTYVVDNLWNQVKRSLHEVPIIKNSFYGTDMILIMPPRACELNKLEYRCKLLEGKTYKHVSIQSENRTNKAGQGFKRTINPGFLR